MIRYLDTSVLVSALTNEGATPRLQQWLAASTPGQLTISQWVATEFSAALSMKLRHGYIDEDGRAVALATFNTLSASKLGMCEIKHAHFGLAARFADHADAGLRGGDALHLAVCSDHGATMFTLDKRLYQAAKTLGVPSEML